MVSLYCTQMRSERKASESWNPFEEPDSKDLSIPHGLPLPLWLGWPLLGTLSPRVEPLPLMGPQCRVIVTPSPVGQRYPPDRSFIHEGAPLK